MPLSLQNSKPIHYAILCLISILALSCAQIGTPKGGPEDTLAPILNPDASSNNYQTNFSEKEIILTFDEWIQLTNPTKEVFISPPLDYPPKFNSRGKTIKLEFSDDEVLKENTTYQINFGKAIKDLTAGNIVENFVFLFSTGPTIDKGSIKGQVTDSETGKGLQDIVVSLYDNLSDTCFTQVKPLYLTKTDKEGQFELNNLRSDTFQIFALKDENVSYTYDLPTELVGYSDSLIILQDSLIELSGVNLSLFDEEDPPRLIEAKQRQRGLITLIYEPMPQNPVITYITNPDIPYFQEINNDTILFWHKDLDSDSARIAIRYPDVLDTFALKNGKDTISQRPLRCLDQNLKYQKDDTLFINWSKPIDSLDIDKITIQDTTGVRPILERGQLGKAIWLLAGLDKGSSYSIAIDSAAVMDWYGKSNKDSIGLTLQTLDPETFGTINLFIVKSDSISYNLSLIKGEDAIKEYTLNVADTLTINALNPGKYKLKIIQDSNKDGRWTTGSIAEKRRPEMIKELTLEDLKVGWDLEATVDIQELFYGTESR